MARVRNGCASEFSSRAPYYHYASHGLNIAVCYAGKVPEIHNMICSLQSLCHFFRNLPKRHFHFYKHNCVLSYCFVGYFPFNEIVPQSE